MCLHICIYLYIYFHTRIHTHTYMNIYVCTQTHTHTHVYAAGLNFGNNEPAKGWDSLAAKQVDTTQSKVIDSHSCMIDSHRQ